MADPIDTLSTANLAESMIALIRFGNTVRTEYTFRRAGLLTIEYTEFTLYSACYDPMAHLP